VVRRLQPAGSVSDFDRLYRQQLRNLYRMLGAEARRSCTADLAWRGRRGEQPAPCGGVMAEPPAPRDSGILLHVSSLPSAHFADDALRWIDWIASAGFTVWQVLPLVIPDSHGSPYQSESAFATNPGFLAPLDPPAVNDSAFQAYRAAEADWLEDFADFRLLKAAHGGAPWTTWPRPTAARDAVTMARWRQQHEPSASS
jgi:4-alpha-glucanotransferase